MIESSCHCAPNLKQAISSLRSFRPCFPLAFWAST
ncbi:hypothetical protein PDIG_85020 [Penicillium digitatum PHI26]|uniref:Uncharacterized protein n=2 Tax=Penicillium digitatum TaxID=36651 RepID=K9F7T8_PEND2|nr:hypothetical protein PDIP_22680 [Penicillium digitatum Pd1]EKV05179.1 hypothetical protein PDIG_85020 [Penicillium digitatum PHI26]EKV19673.1 hypothetical protein PDIP_22680 [Penicillium digitatum Pd1]